MSKITLGYWNIRGLGEPIRLLLHYKSIPFTDKRYDFEAPEVWKKDKFNLGLDFPNLPYLIDGDIKLTQSIAILRYLASKYNLDGDTQQDKVKAFMVEQQLVDVNSKVCSVVYFEDQKQAKLDFVEKAEYELNLVASFLGDKNFFIGDSVTYVDFMATEFLDVYRYYVPEVFKKFVTLKAHFDRVMSLPQLQEYLNSLLYRRWPIFDPVARFGGGGDEPQHE